MNIFGFITVVAAAYFLWLAISHGRAWRALGWGFVLGVALMFCGTLAVGGYLALAVPVIDDTVAEMIMAIPALGAALAVWSLRKRLPQAKSILGLFILVMLVGLLATFL